MLLKSLNLVNFRNYSKKNFTFSPTTTLVVGPNASGKTNLLEAVYYLAAGKSFRATYDREVIKSGEEFTGIKGLKGVGEGDDGELELAILAGEGNRSSKRFKVNGVKKRMTDFVGNLRVVYFGPEEILLVTGSPSRRRRYIDLVLTQVDREYARALSEYEKVLRQRNKLLSLIREGETLRDQLGIWDPKLSHLGAVLTKKRQEMFADFNAWLKGFGLFLLFEQRPWSNKKELREREIAAGMTLRGPHRDDFSFIQNSVVVASYAASPLGDDGPRRLSGRLPSSPRSDLSIFGSRGEPRKTRDLAVYGSRGEQRLAVLQLKLAELEFIAKKTDDRPILLLDDIFSELDKDNRDRVLELLGKQQTIITSTEAGVLNSEREIRNLKQIQMTKIRMTKTASF